MLTWGCKEFSVIYQILDYPPLDLVKDLAEKTNEPKLINMAKIFNASYAPTLEAVNY
jgi:hypothetical protein